MHLEGSKILHLEAGEIEQKVDKKIFYTLWEGREDEKNKEYRMAWKDGVVQGRSEGRRMKITDLIYKVWTADVFCKRREAKDKPRIAYNVRKRRHGRRLKDTPSGFDGLGENEGLRASPRKHGGGFRVKSLSNQ